MGNRVKGKPKQKSIKAKSHSKMGSQRKLSRMGKKQKRHHAGLEATFIGRSKALKMLQITIKDFRRLCILKGIYPREPLGGKVPGNKRGQTFYHIKDIRAIAHEPVLEKFREFRAFMKKIRRAAGRNERDEALRKNTVCPSYTLHHLVRERYPRFADALGDLDDALTLTYLFAALPTTTSIKPKVIQKAKQLASSWGAYCATTCCIHKSFISVKGIYLEASLMLSSADNIPVRWVVPHSFTQFLPEDVDYRVMATFFEFYETLLQFVLYKLYSDIGVRYPLPTTTTTGTGINHDKGSTSVLLAAHLQSLSHAAMLSGGGAVANVITQTAADTTTTTEQVEMTKPTKADKKKAKALLETVGDALDHIEESDNEDDEEAGTNIAEPLKAALESMKDDQERMANGNKELDEAALKRKRLFAGLTFFLSREVPRGYLELVILAFGGKVGWEGNNTHSPIAVHDSSITHHIVDRPQLPSSYSSLPKSREYVQPQWILDSTNFMFLLPIVKYGVGTALPPHLSPWVDNDEEGYTPKYAKEIERLKNGETVLSEEEDDEEVENQPGETAPAEKEDSEAADSESEDDEDEKVETKAAKKTKQKKSDQRKKKEEEEAHALAKTMMSRKASHLYGRMQHGIEKKKAKVDALEARRSELEHRSKKNDDKGRTPLKQKVDRLKAERKHVMESYSNTGGSMKKKSKKNKKTKAAK